MVVNINKKTYLILNEISFFITFLKIKQEK